MGGTTKTQSTVSSQNQAFNQLQQQQQQQQQRQQQAQSGTSTAQLTPWDTTQDLLTGILGQLGGIQAGPSPLETTALSLLSSSAARGNPYAGRIGGAADTLLGGGGLDPTLYHQAYQQYQAALAPFAGGAYVDPASNPALQKYLDVARTDAADQVNGMFAGAGRDFSGLHAQALGRGIEQAEAPILMDAYNRALSDRVNAINALYGAGNTTGGLLNSLTQQRLANMQAGISAADVALGAETWGPLQMLQVEAQRRGIPLQTLATQMGLVLPAAQAFGTRTGTETGTQTGTMSGTQLGTTSGTSRGTGTQQTTQSTPFNALSLLPLAFAPLTGGTSLAGGLFGKIFG